ncbi:MAG TPA: (2Fe-2S)-binding protein [Anaerolineae bacterium]|nr:(2Fe-2S)-binding protein [Anaerolineae bacterium]
MKHHISFTINGQSMELTVLSHQTLLEVIRNDLRLTGAKHGCSTGECGACSVIMNGEVVNACMVLAPEVDGTDILTVEGLSDGEELHPLQKSFIDHHGVQCGYCAPGMLISAKALLSRTSRPHEEEIREALVGNLCRCGAYADIIKSIQVASRARR